LIISKRLKFDATSDDDDDDDETVVAEVVISDVSESNAAVGEAALDGISAALDDSSTFPAVAADDLFIIHVYYSHFHSR